MKNVPRLVPGWTDPIVVGRHAFGDQYKATDFRVPGPGKLRLVFEGEDGTLIDEEVFLFPSSGVAMAMYNLDDSIRDFARASLNYGLARKWPVYLSMLAGWESPRGFRSRCARETARARRSRPAGATSSAPGTSAAGASTS